MNNLKQTIEATLSAHNTSYVPRWKIEEALQTLREEGIPHAEFDFLNPENAMHGHVVIWSEGHNTDCVILYPNHTKSIIRIWGADLSVSDEADLIRIIYTQRTQIKAAMKDSVQV